MSARVFAAFRYWTKVQLGAGGLKAVIWPPGGLAMASYPITTILILLILLALVAYFFVLP